MKRIITTVVLLFTLTMYSQHQFFIAEDSELIVGKKVILKDRLELDSYKGFYKDKSLVKILFRKSLGSNPKKLNGIEFKVIRTFKSRVKYYTKRDIVLELYNKKTGKIYYTYDSKSPNDFLLKVIGGIEFPEDYFCKKLKTKEDTFLKKVRITTPNTYEYSIAKVKEDNSNFVYLKLQSYGSTLNIDVKGLKIKFSDGTILEKPNAKIKNKNESGLKGWTYSCFVSLNEEDIITLSSKTITSYSLSIYERKMNKKNSFELKEFLKCLRK